MQFLYPNVLFLMLIPSLILFILIVTQKSKFEKIFDQNVLNKLSIGSSNLTKKSRNILLFISLLSMIIALSRPVTNEKEQNISQELIPIVIAIDASKSMLAQDVYPNRLKMAKKKISNLIKSSNQLSVGIIIFGESSFILSPLTNDFVSLNFLIENFDYNLSISNGSNIFSALEASNKLLKDYKSKNILLLSDGGNANEYQEEIEYANKNNLNIYTITIATKTPTPIPTNEGYLNDKNGNIVMLKLNENIKQLSLNTGAGYTNYTLNNKDINSIIHDISKKTEKISMEVKKQKIYTELFYYPLGFALFVLLIAFSSIPSIKSFSKLSVMLIFLNNININASILDFNTIKDATTAYNKKDYQTASNKFKDFINTNEGKYNFANSLYKEKKYQSALNMYKDIATSDDTLEFKKLHNMGNAYVKLNDLNSAKKMYEKALKIKEDKQTKENLDIVNKALKNKQNQQPKQNQDDKKSDKQNKSDEKNTHKQKDEKKEDKKSSESKNNEKLLSKKEEKKWLNLLKNQQTPILLKKIETKNNSKNSSSSPW